MVACREGYIGRLKTYSILKGTLPNTLSRIANQVVSVCAWLTNFHPALVTISKENTNSDVDDYFQDLEDDEFNTSSSENDNDY